jgi:TolA-binding protein
MEPLSMASRSSGSGSGRGLGSGAGPQAQLPDWLPWLQAGLTAMLAVLFLVIVGKLRQQSSQLHALKERVQGLENSRALERTTALEQQLRSTAARLQELERSNTQLEGLSSDNARLRRELLQLRRPMAPAPVAPAEPAAEAPAGPTPPPPVRP